MLMIRSPLPLRRLPRHLHHRRHRHRPRQCCDEL